MVLQIIYYNLKRITFLEFFLKIALKCAKLTIPICFKVNVPFLLDGS